MKPRILENYRPVVQEHPIGTGGEHNVYLTTDGYHVVKVKAPVTGEWQTQGEDFVTKIEASLEREDVPRLPSAILVHPSIIIEKDPNSQTGKRGKDRIIQPDAAQMFPKLDGYENLTLRWPQIKNPQIQKQLIELCRKAEDIFKKDRFGMDPMGIAAVGDGLEGLLKALLGMVYKKIPQSPETVRELIRKYVESGINGQMRNILVADKDRFLEGEAAKPYTGSESRVQILEKGKIYLTDTGMHDLRETPPIGIIQAIRNDGLVNVLRRIPAQQLTFPAHYFMWASMIELLIHANPDLKSRTDLPFTHGQNLLEQAMREITRKISRILVEIMIPQFEKHEASS